MKPKFPLRNLLLLSGCLAITLSSVHAQSNSWSGDAAGNWNDPARWTGGVTIADGADNTATFGNVITLDRIVTLGADRTIGNITASDTTHNYTISGANILTFDRTDATKPTINVTQSGRTLTINSQISGNDGLLKSGAGDLVLGGNNNFTGGLDISAGRIVYDNLTNANAWGAAANVITFTGNATLHNNNNAYTLARGITINGGVTASMTGAFGESTNVTGVVGGSGTLRVEGFSNGWALTLSNASNTFTGAIDIIASTSASLSVASLGSSANNITLSNGTNTGTFTYTGGAALSRGFVMGGTTGGSTINASGAGALTASSFSITGSGAKTLTLDGSSSATNQISGNIVNNGGNTSVTKTGGGIWALGGTNSYSGNTNLLASGTTGVLIFQGAQSLSANTTLIFAQNSSAVQSVRFLDDGGTPGIINFNRPIQFGGTNTTQALNIAVGNNNTNNGGSSAGTTTGRTIQVGDISFTSVAGDTNTTTINATSPNSNNYRLQTGTITLNNLVSRAAGSTTTTVFNPTTANMTVAAITMATGNTGIANDGVPVVRLDGTATDNFVTGVISNATDFATGQALSLQKTNTSTWTLSGANTFSGNTTLTGGILVLNNSLALQNSALNTTGSTLATGVLGLRAGTGGTGITALTFGGLTGNKNLSTLFTSTTGGYGNVDTLTLNLGTGITHNYTAVISDGATGMSITKSGLGTQILTNTQTYTGATNVNAGVLQLDGSTHASSTVNVGTAGTLTGTGTVNGNATLTGSGIINKASGTISGTLGVTGGNWNGAGAVTGLVTSSSGLFTIGSGANLTANGNLNVTGGTIAAGNSSSTITGSVNYTSASSSTFAGVIAGSGRTLTMNSASTTLTLTGTSTYTGATNVDAGNLMVNGNISTSVLTTVGINGTLSGSGTVGMTLINGTLAVGNSPGQMNFTNTLGLNGSTIMEIDGTMGAGVTGGHDFVNLTGVGAAGVLTYGGNMTLDIGAIFGVGAYTWNLFDMASETGTFATITLADQYSGALLDADLNGVWDLASGNNTWQFTESTGVLGLNVIPEPDVAALLGALGVILLLRRRR